MGEEGKVFKISCFGGFKKAEVLSYIESAAEENRKKLEELECSAAALRRDYDAAREEAETLSTKNTALAQKNAELLERLSAMTVAQEQFQKEIEEKTEEAQIFSEAEDELRARVGELETQVASLARDRDAMARRAEKLEAQSEEYRLSKEKLPEIELCAYKRAQEIEAKAQLEAKNIRIESAHLISAIKKKIESVGEQYAEYLKHCEGQLTAFQQQAADILTGMNEVTASLDETIVGELAKNAPDAANLPKRPTMEDVINQFESGEVQDGTL